MKRKYKTLAGLLAKPERWTKCAFAKDANGYVTQINSDNAVCFCLFGGSTRVYPEFDFVFRTELLCKALGVSPWTTDIATWNDSPRRKHADILRVARRFDKLVKARAAK